MTTEKRAVTTRDEAAVIARFDAMAKAITAKSCEAIAALNMATVEGGFGGEDPNAVTADTVRLSVLSFMRQLYIDAELAETARPARQSADSVPEMLLQSLGMFGSGGQASVRIVRPAPMTEDRKRLSALLSELPNMTEEQVSALLRQLEKPDDA